MRPHPAFGSKSHHPQSAPFENLRLHPWSRVSYELQQNRAELLKDRGGTMSLRIALMRSIGINGQRVKMADARALAERVGGTEVQSVIATGKSPVPFRQVTPRPRAGAGGRM
jgi:hypothetical protein